MKNVGGAVVERLYGVVDAAFLAGEVYSAMADLAMTAPPRPSTRTIGIHNSIEPQVDFPTIGGGSDNVV
jgi:hypothetical protein